LASGTKQISLGYINAGEPPSSIVLTFFENGYLGKSAVRTGRVGTITNQ